MTSVKNSQFYTISKTDIKGPPRMGIFCNNKWLTILVIITTIIKKFKHLYRLWS